MTDGRTLRAMADEQDLRLAVEQLVVRSPGVTAVELLANLREAGWRISRRRLNRILAHLVEHSVIIVCESAPDQDARFTRYMEAA